MYCDECDIDIPYTTDTCPLCLKKLSDEVTPDNPMYPRRNASFRFPVRYSFTLFYAVIAFTTFFVMLIINLVTSKHILWAFIVGAGYIYLYVLIRHTIMTSYGSASKIFVQGLILSFLILIIQNVTHSGAWAYDYVIPMILLANTIALWAVGIVRRKRRANYIFNLIIISVLNLAPLYWYLTERSTVLWTTIMSTVVACATASAVLLVFGKLLLGEVKRLLHL
ncbi:MAG: DUF6320 domain-containing protein [Christensenellales bacterium]|jgi:hypothetical protein